jgi:transglutaminase-like putative cysteine protease
MKLLMLIMRLSAAITVTCLLALLAWQLDASQPAAAARASGMLGERWYQLSLAGEPMGYWFTNTYRDHSGQWIFASEQRAALNPDNPITISTRRVFAATAPFELIEAEYRQQQRHSAERILISRDAAGYSGQILRADGDNESPPVSLDWQYTMSDYLAFETWLHDTAPAADSVRAIRTLDFESMAVVARALKVVERNTTGYRIENPAPQAATSIQLNKDYVPQDILLAGLFDLTLSSRDQALTARSPLHAASYYVPLDRPLTDHTRISTLELTVASDVPAEEIWADSERRGGEWVLTLHANPLTPQSTHAFSGSTLNYPTQDLRISQLSAAATAGIRDDAEKVAALVSYVHDYLRYEAGASAQTVLALLDNPVGDCTEFADLFTTLARSQDIPSRTVFGLAYSDRNAPAFAFHAWNEVEVGGVWQAVDPTWNQLRVDATHIPLPFNESTAMKLLTGTTTVAFKLRNLEYFND